MLLSEIVVVQQLSARLSEPCGSVRQELGRLAELEAASLYREADS